MAPDCVVWANHVGIGQQYRLIAYEVPCPCAGGCPADLDGDGVVGIIDFLDLLAQWGTDPGGPPDLNGDGDVGIHDLLGLLANWGPCPESAMPEPPSLAQELQDACLSEDDWDEYVDVMTDEGVSQATKDRYDCWMRHFLIECSRCSCPHHGTGSGCPNPNPFHWFH